MMGETQKDNPEVGVAEADVRPKRGFSIVWLVPLVAAIIGGWLIFKAVTEKGPIIIIVFESAEGLEAGKTKIKYKEVEVGQVKQINLDEDLSHVIVTAELVREVKKIPDGRYPVLGGESACNRRRSFRAEHALFWCLYRYGAGKAWPHHSVAVQGVGNTAGVDPDATWRAFSFKSR